MISIQFAVDPLNAEQQGRDKAIIKELHRCRAQQQLVKTHDERENTKAENHPGGQGAAHTFVGPVFDFMAADVSFPEKSQRLSAADKFGEHLFVCWTGQD